MSTITIISFGFGHAPAPEDVDLVLDLRRRFRDPHVNPAMRQQTGLDEEVFEHVLNTEGVEDYVNALTALVRGMAGDVDVAIGCVGGRHRSVAIARALYINLCASQEDGVIHLTHRDVEKAVIKR